MKHITLILFLLFAYSRFYSQNKLNDSTANISIHAEAYKLKTFQLYFRSNTKPTITLDSNGFGKTSISLKEPLFVDVGSEDSTYFELLMEPGYDLNCTISKSSKKIEGIGSNANNYLLQVSVFLDSLDANTSAGVERNKQPKDFLHVMHEYEVKFASFHRKFTDSVPLTASISYILKSRMIAKLLLLKQRFILFMDQKEIDSLDLENKFALLANDLFKDTLLIRSGQKDFSSFLMFSGDQTLYKIVAKYPEVNIYPLLFFSEIYKSSKYSAPIKEFLLYNFLDFQLTNKGITPILEYLCEVFDKIYPASYYTEFIKKHVEKFKTLTYGNPAPDFTGRTVTGQVISLDDFKGKFLLIDVWATWCGPCKKELPFTQKIQDIFKNEEFSVIYISIDSDTKKWKEYLSKNKWLTGIQVNIDDKTFKNSYKISGIPRYILIDKHGNIIEAFEELPSNGRLEAKVRTLLN